jgi:hypothetical protein
MMTAGMAGMVTYAACRWYFASVWLAMAQMNPSSSRPTATTFWFLFLPLAVSFV